MKDWPPPTGGDTPPLSRGLALWRVVTSSSDCGTFLYPGPETEAELRSELRRLRCGNPPHVLSVKLVRPAYQIETTRL